MKLYRQVMKQYAPGANANDVYHVYGMAAAWTAVEALRKAGKNLTRAGLVKVVSNMNLSNNPFLLPGIALKTAPGDHFPIEQMLLQRWNKGAGRASAGCGATAARRRRFSSPEASGGSRRGAGTSSRLSREEQLALGPAQLDPGARPARATRRSAAPTVGPLSTDVEARSSAVVARPLADADRVGTFSGSRSRETRSSRAAGAPVRRGAGSSPRRQPSGSRAGTSTVNGAVAAQLVERELAPARAQRPGAPRVSGGWLDGERLRRSAPYAISVTSSRWNGSPSSVRLGAQEGTRLARRTTSSTRSAPGPTRKSADSPRSPSRGVALHGQTSCRPASCALDGRLEAEGRTRARPDRAGTRTRMPAARPPAPSRSSRDPSRRPT